MKCIKQVIGITLGIVQLQYSTKKERIKCALFIKRLSKQFHDSQRLVHALFQAVRVPSHFTKICLGVLCYKLKNYTCVLEFVYFLLKLEILATCSFLFCI